MYRHKWCRVATSLSRVHLLVAGEWISAEGGAGEGGGVRGEARDDALQQLHREEAQLRECRVQQREGVKGQSSMCGKIQKQPHHKLPKSLVTCNKLSYMWSRLIS